MTYDEWIFPTPADDACPDCDGDGRVDCPTCQAEEPDGDYQYERRRDAQMEGE